jgi:hypothetical protein
MPDEPFQFGATYRVREDFAAERDSFRAGEELVYWRYGSSTYDGMQGWFFRQPGAPTVRSWDLPLGEDPRPAFMRLFEQLAGPDPLIAAAEPGAPEALEVALSSSAPASRALMVELAIERAVQTGQAAAIFRLLALGLVPGPRCTALLHTAAQAGKAVSVRALLDGGIPANAEDSAGQTALHHAAAAGDVDTVGLLLDRGANPRATTPSGTTPLSLARAWRRSEVVALLEARE